MAVRLEPIPNILDDYTTVPMVTMLISEKGKTFKGKPLNEDNLNARELVLYRNRLYISGNRHHSLVELYGVCDMQLKYNANVKSVSLVKNKGI